MLQQLQQEDQRHLYPLKGSLEGTIESSASANQALNRMMPAMFWRLLSRLFRLVPSRFSLARFPGRSTPAPVSSPLPPLDQPATLGTPGNVCDRSDRTCPLLKLSLGKSLAIQDPTQAEVFFGETADTCPIFGDKLLSRSLSTPLANFLLEKLQEYEQMMQELRQQRSRELLVNRIAQKIRQSLDLDDILNTTVTEVRDLLQTDRVILYQFDADWNGQVVKESVASDCLAILGEQIDDPCFRDKLVQHYRQGRVRAIEDIETAGLSECHQALLTRYGVRANLVVPIAYGDRLWGLLIAHHCRTTRHWRQHEITLLNELATQSAIAIHQGELYQQLEASNQELQRLSEYDGLTQIANRYRFDRYLNQEWNRLLRTQSCLSLILCDVDYFKRFNDTYGHQAGDRALQQVAQAMTQVSRRPADLVARYGGEEFAMILPDTPSSGAKQVAEHLRQVIHTLPISHCQSPHQHLTLSCGVATLIPRPDCSPQDLIESADQALYQAKEGGRDRVVICQKQQSFPGQTTPQSCRL